MTEMIKNDRVILLSAQEDLRDGRYNQVVNKAEHLLGKYPQSVELNDLYANALYHLKRYADAGQVVADFAEDFIAQPRYQGHAMEILLANNLFMSAREVLAQVPTSKKGEWKQRIVTAENDYRQQHSTELAAKSRKFAYLGALSVTEQVHEVQAALHLPLNEYLSAAKTLLNDPYGWQVSKTQVLLQLMKAQVSENVDLIWLDGKTHTISLDELKPLEKIDAFVRVLQIVEQQFAAKDPIKLDLLERELFTQSNYIYPYFDDVITGPNFWAQAIIAQSFGEPLPAKTQQQQRMLSWINQIHDQEIKIGLI